MLTTCCNFIIQNVIFGILQTKNKNRVPVCKLHTFYVIWPKKFQKVVDISAHLLTKFYDIVTIPCQVISILVICDVNIIWSVK
jgi:hypothetical protein